MADIANRRKAQAVDFQTTPDLGRSRGSSIEIRDEKAP
jgi:hypothetical protein